MGDENNLLEPEFVEVTLGDHDINSTTVSNIEQKYVISNIEVHPLYDPSTLDNDIAKLHLDQPIDFSKHPKIRPICLPTNANEDYVGRDAKATGWGTMKRYTPAVVLQEISIQVISLGECNDRLANYHKARAFKHYATEMEICAIGAVPQWGDFARICQGSVIHLFDSNIKNIKKRLDLFFSLFIRFLSGDSGGPLSVVQRSEAGYSGPPRRELIGVVSSLGAKRCTLNVPDKFTAVAKYLDWIKEE